METVYSTINDVVNILKMRVINTFKTYGVTCVDLSDYSDVIKDISFRKDLHCLEIVQNCIAWSLLVSSKWYYLFFLYLF